MIFDDLRIGDWFTNKWPNIKGFTKDSKVMIKIKIDTDVDLGKAVDLASGQYYYILHQQKVRRVRKPSLNKLKE